MTIFGNFRIKFLTRNTNTNKYKPLPKSKPVDKDISDVNDFVNNFVNNFVNDFVKFLTGEICRSGKPLQLQVDINDISDVNNFVNNFVNDFVSDFVNNFVNDFVKFLTGEIGRSGKIIKEFEFLTDNAMKLIENKSVVLSWAYSQPYFSTLLSKFTYDTRTPPKPPHFDEIVIKFKFNALKLMKLIENKNVALSWVYLQPFCST